MHLLNRESESNSCRKQAHAMLCATLALALTTTSVSAVQAQDQSHWNQFRGPNGDGKTLWLKHREVDSDLGDLLKAEGLSKADIEETKKEKPGDNRKAYATPTVITFQDKKQLISPGAEVTFAYNPAQL